MAAMNRMPSAAIGWRFMKPLSVVGGGEEVRAERARHEDLAVGEVDHAEDAVHERVSQCDEGEMAPCAIPRTTSSFHASAEYALDVERLVRTPDRRTPMIPIESATRIMRRHGNRSNADIRTMVFVPSPGAEAFAIQRPPTTAPRTEPRMSGARSPAALVRSDLLRLSPSL